MSIKLCMRPREATEDLECAICYKRIDKVFTSCAEPCNKVFHNSCMEQMMAQTEESAYEEDRDAEHKCCYCRRLIDMPYYDLLRMERALYTMNRRCYNVHDALHIVYNEMKKSTPNEDIMYEIFMLRDIYHEKKPKQAKRVQAMKQTRAPRVHIRQNIGGRKR